MCSLISNITYWSTQEPFKNSRDINDYGNYIKSNEQQLILKINKIGFNIVSVGNDLVNPRPEIAAKVHLLTDVLIEAVDDESLHPSIVECVVRIFGLKDIVKYRDLYDYLWQYYKIIPPSVELKNPQARGVDQAFAESLSMHFKNSYLNKHRELIFDESLGESRGLLLIGLSKNRDNDEVEYLLRELADHPLYYKQVKVILKKARKRVALGR